MKYYFNISFPKIDFDSFMLKTAKSETIHEACLYFKNDEIELRIYFKPETFFGKKFSSWASKINYNAFGSNIIADNVEQNDRLQKIDFSDSILLKIQQSSDYYERGLKYVSLIIDSVKLYRNPIAENINTAEFYLNKAGFNVVKGYYTPLSHKNGEFSISRKNDRCKLYKIEDAHFKPEFNFCSADSINNNEAIIRKEPKIQFWYTNDTTENKAIKYADIIRLVASFYFHSSIGYNTSIIHLKDTSLTIIKTPVHDVIDNDYNLFGFKINWRFHKFMEKDWKTKAIENYDKLSKVIAMFVQSLNADDTARFLIRYNIIEVCMGGAKKVDPKFDETLYEERKRKYEKALELLLETIIPEEHNDFKKKWESISGKLIYKPMKSPLESFLKSQNLSTSEFPITVNKLKKLRDDITHGSIKRVKQGQLERANILLYRITGILILNLLGIEEWELDTNIQ